MNFEAFKEFKEGRDLDVKSVAFYLSQELAGVLRGLRAGLQKLSFTDNFECFEQTITIPAVSELPIRNQLRNKMPTRWIAVRKNAAGLSVCDGDTTWTQDYLYLKNTHATNAATLTVIFFR